MFQDTIQTTIAGKKWRLILALPIIFCLLAAPVMVKNALAQSEGDVDEPNLWGVGDDGATADYFTDATNLGERDPRETIANVINIMLGFLGIMAVIIILIGGFKWMTAGGNEDQVGEAKQWIFSGVIGLVIILASYAIATFVLKQLIKATATG